MPAGIRFKSRVLALSATLGCLLVLGCSDDGLGKRYYVGGTVKYNGKPVEKGEINFVATTEGGRAASGVIENGSYSLTTLTPGDGALPGKYEVTIASREVDLSAAQAKVGKMGGNVSLPQEMVGKAYKNAKNNIPAKYSTPSTSGLTKEVKEQSNTIDFDLTD